jgi:hypothetical protein
VQKNLYSSSHSLSSAIRGEAVLEEMFLDAAERAAGLGGEKEP